MPRIEWQDILYAAGTRMSRASMPQVARYKYHIENDVLFNNDTGILGERNTTLYHIIANNVL